MNPDILLFHALNDLVGYVAPIDWLAQVLVNDFFVPTTLSLVAAWLWFAGDSAEERLRYQRAVIFIALGLLFANALIKDMSYIYFRPRPFATESVKLLFYRPSVSSFPSVPIAVAFSFAVGAWSVRRDIGRAMLLLAILYAISRVYAGVHYPADVAGGALIGGGMVLVVRRLAFIFQPLADSAVNIARRFGYD